jgi:hypothetical protein
MEQNQIKKLGNNSSTIINFKTKEPNYIKLYEKKSHLEKSTAKKALIGTFFSFSLAKKF